MRLGKKGGGDWRDSEDSDAQSTMPATLLLLGWERQLTVWLNTLGPTGRMQRLQACPGWTFHRSPSLPASRLFRMQCWSQATHVHYNGGAAQTTQSEASPSSQCWTADWRISWHSPGPSWCRIALTALPQSSAGHRPDQQLLTAPAALWSSCRQGLLYFPRLLEWSLH